MSLPPYETSFILPKFHFFCVYLLELPLFCLVFSTFCNNFTIRECAARSFSCFWAVDHDPLRNLHISNWYYIDRFCNTAYRLTHRNLLEIVCLCIWGEVTSLSGGFVVFLLTLTDKVSMMCHTGGPTHFLLCPKTEYQSNNSQFCDSRFSNGFFCYWPTLQFRLRFHDSNNAVT